LTLLSSATYKLKNSIFYLQRWSIILSALLVHNLTYPTLPNLTFPNLT
jgi:hypothetical protein